MRPEVEPYEPCPWSVGPPDNEPHPHSAGYSFARSYGMCAVCEKPVHVTRKRNDLGDAVMIDYRLERGPMP